MLNLCLFYQVYIIGHIPPGFFEKKRGKPWYTPKFNKLYLDLIEKHQSVIQGQFFGHHHTDSFRMFYSLEGKHSLFVRSRPCNIAIVFPIFSIIP